MTARFRLTMAQLNPTVGDLAGNAAQARQAWETAREAKADLVALPEMFLTGYQLQDLVRRRAFFSVGRSALGGWCGVLCERCRRHDHESKQKWK